MESMSSFSVGFHNGLQKVEKIKFEELKTSRKSFVEVLKGEPSMATNRRKPKPKNIEQPHDLWFNDVGKMEVRVINWDETIVVTRRDFHEDWGRILNILQEYTQHSYIINPF